MCLAFPLPRIGETIRTRLDDPSRARAESIANILKPRLTALIFNAIVQKGSDGKVLVAAILQDRRSYRQQVSDVWRRSSFADLAPMDMGSIEEGAIKSIS
jgi:hypothetical protein